MKGIIALCSILAVAASVGADEDGLRSSGTEEAEERPRFTPAMCPTPDSRFDVKVTQAGNNCVEFWVTRDASNTTTHLRDARTLEEFRDFFKNFCQKQPLVRTCLAETTVSVEVCRNETFLKTFNIYRDVIETILNIGCNEDGEQLATLGFELVDFVFRNKDNILQIRECGNKYALISGEIEKSEIDISSKLYNTHKQVEAFAECFYRIEITQSFKDGLKNFMDVIINGMKCIHPNDGNLVPCVSIDTSLISVTNICDMKTTGAEMSLYDVLEEDSGACTMDFLHYSDEDVDSNEKIRDIVEHDCKYRDSLPYCYNTSRIISEMCLNDTQQKEFELLGDFIESAHEEGCIEDGKRLSDIAYEVYRLKRAGQGHAVWDCIDVALSTRNVTDEHRSSSKNMRFYHEMEAFKGCLVNKLQGDQTSVAAATSLIDELLKKVKCVHPEEGITVLCETLHNKA